MEIRDEVLVTVLQALGVDASTDEAITTALEDRRKYEHELLSAFPCCAALASAIIALFPLQYASSQHRGWLACAVVHRWLRARLIVLQYTAL